MRGSHTQQEEFHARRNSAGDGAIARSSFSHRLRERRSTAAGEGMWTMNTLDKCPFDQWRAKGLALGPQEIYNPDRDRSLRRGRAGGRRDGFFRVSQRTHPHQSSRRFRRPPAPELGEDQLYRGWFSRADPRRGDPRSRLRGPVSSLDIEDVTKQVMSGVNDKTPTRNATTRSRRISRRSSRRPRRARTSKRR